MTVNRRHFLVGVAAAADAAFGQDAGSRIPTAMIGTGNRGSQVLKGVLEQPNAKVAALCDLKADRLDAAASAASKDNPKTYKDWRQVIDQKDIQAVFIATPPYLHSEMAVAALQAGKHVYCEKPIGVTPEQVKKLVQVAKNSRKVFVVGQQLRSFEGLKQAVGKIHEGAIGNVLMVKAQRHGSTDIPHDASSADWYFDVNKSGGYLTEMSVHNLDACNWAIGAHPLKVAGFGGTLLYKNDPPGRDIMDCSTLSYEYPNGVILSFTQNVFHPGKLPHSGQYILVYGSKSAADLMYSYMAYPLAKDAQPVALAPKIDEPTHAHVKAFYECIVSNGPNPADITVGATAALTSIMGTMAINKQKVLTWQELGVSL